MALLPQVNNNTLQDDKVVIKASTCQASNVLKEFEGHVFICKVMCLLLIVPISTIFVFLLTFTELISKSMS